MQRKEITAAQPVVITQGETTHTAHTVHTAQTAHTAQGTRVISCTLWRGGGGMCWSTANGWGTLDLGKEHTAHAHTLVSGTVGKKYGHYFCEYLANVDLHWNGTFMTFDMDRSQKSYFNLCLIAAERSFFCAKSVWQSVQFGQNSCCNHDTNSTHSSAHSARSTHGTRHTHGTRLTGVCSVSWPSCTTHQGQPR
jgi:hypothetical protein